MQTEPIDNRKEAVANCCDGNTACREMNLRELITSKRRLLMTKLIKHSTINESLEILHDMLPLEMTDRQEQAIKTLIRPTLDNI